MLILKQQNQKIAAYGSSYKEVSALKKATILMQNGGPKAAV